MVIQLKSQLLLQELLVVVITISKVEDIAIVQEMVEEAFTYFKYMALLTHQVAHRVEYQLQVEGSMEVK